MNRRITRLEGLYNTLAPFYVMSGNQESISKGEYISLECFHTKIYTTDSQVEFHMQNGNQSGQLKKITFVHKGNEHANAILFCLSLPGDSSKIEFTNVGDSATLMYTGGIWIVLETLNYPNPSLFSPVVT